MSLHPVGRLGLRLSVIVTTYNSPRALALVLAGLRRQSIRDFELLIADDGSGPETKALIDAYAEQTSAPVHHVWHADEGVRKCAIMNKAVLAASGDYLVFFDGDCIAPSTCLEIHLREARRDCYLAGGKVLLSQALTDRISQRDVEEGRFDRMGLWWWEIERARRLMVGRIPLLRTLLDRWVPREPSWRGENSSGFAEHIDLVGGFDERFSVGFDDADFGHRLQAAGVHGRSIRYSAPVFHLEHARPYQNHARMAANQAVYNENRIKGITVTPYGFRPRGLGSSALTLPPTQPPARR